MRVVAGPPRAREATDAPRGEGTALVPLTLTLLRLFAPLMPFMAETDEGEGAEGAEGRRSSGLSSGECPLAMERVGQYILAEEK